MANTPFLNLFKPTDQDQALVTDINSNMDKIDTGVSTLSDQIATNDFGTKTLANVQAAIVTLSGSMSNYQTKPIAFTLSEAAGDMPSTAYVGYMYRLTSTRITVDVRQSVNANCAYIGNYKDGTWYWDKLATKSDIGDISWLKVGITTTEKTLTIGNGTRAVMFVGDSTENQNGEYMLFSNSTGGVALRTIVAANNLTINTSTANKLKLTAASGTRIITFQISAGSITE